MPESCDRSAGALRFSLPFPLSSSSSSFVSLSAYVGLDLRRSPNSAWTCDRSGTTIFRLLLDFFLGFLRGRGP